MTPSVRRVVAPLVGIVTFALLWEAAVRAFDIRRFVLLPPSTIIRQLTEAPGFYWSNALITGWHVLVGLSIAMAFAIVTGALMASSRFVEEATQPVLILILVTPWVAYITSVVLWLDGGAPTILFMVAFTSFPVFTFGVVGGMKSADPAARELLASIDARPWEVFWRLRSAGVVAVDLHHPAVRTRTRARSGVLQRGLGADQGRSGRDRAHRRGEQPGRDAVGDDHVRRTARHRRPARHLGARTHPAEVARIATLVSRSLRRHCRPARDRPPVGVRDIMGIPRLLARLDP
jgi:hypothetical protein